MTEAVWWWRLEIYGDLIVPRHKSEQEEGLSPVSWSQGGRDTRRAGGGPGLQQVSLCLTLQATQHKLSTLRAFSQALSEKYNINYLALGWVTTKHEKIQDIFACRHLKKKNKLIIYCDGNMVYYEGKFPRLQF